MLVSDCVYDERRIISTIQNLFSLYSKCMAGHSTLTRSELAAYFGVRASVIDDVLNEFGHRILRNTTAQDQNVLYPLHWVDQVLAPLVEVFAGASLEPLGNELPRQSISRRRVA
jgi:hypothetical protein